MRLTYAHLGPLPEFLDGDAAPAVRRVSAPTGDRLWLVTGYRLGRRVLADPRFSRAAAAAPHAPRLNTANPAPTSVMSRDGADHARLRKLVAGAFSPRRVAALAPGIRAMVDGYLDAMALAGPPVDVIAALALPLPLTVASELLGIPAADRDSVREWAGVLFDVSASTPADKARRGFALYAYMSRLLAAKRREPADDVLSDVAAADGLAEPERVDLALALLTAGYETTVGQIGLSLFAVLSQPGPLAVEEYLRLTPATPATFTRVALTDVDLDGVTVAAGDAVVVSLLHANRDPEVFDDPDAAREDRAAHLTFGHGPHFCVGASLARLQLDAALGGVVARFPGLRIVDAPDAVAWHDGYVTRGLSRLLVTW